MDGIVIELESEALDENISIESLMRKAYLVAKKLNLVEFVEWINQEQNGYIKKVPEYRNITGETKAWNPYNGWIPLLSTAKFADKISRVPVTDSISALLDVYNSSESTVYFSVNGATTEFLNKNTDFMPTKYAFFTSKSELYRIMSTVRNKILEWALVLEENGIIGKGMTFTDVEQKKALDTYVINNYTNNFYGSVSDVSMKQGE